MFNEDTHNNEYVGLQYTSGQAHGTGTNSGILGTSTSTDTTTLYGWYNSKIKPSYSSIIDTNAGFCSDRDPYTDKNGTTLGGGTGTTTTYYGAFIRILNSSGGWNTTQTPTFKCKNNSDLFTKTGATKGNKSLTNPIGLITADEAVYAGGLGEDNRNYYLFTGYTYWTMTPYAFSSDAYAFMTCLFTYGNLGINNSLNALYPVRPVINIRSDVTLTGTGTASNPYVVH